MDIETRRKKLLHRARYRGFREADIMIGGFAEEAIGAMGAGELDAFETLLACNDHDIYSYVVGALPVPAGIDSALIARISRFDAVRKTQNPDG